MTTIEHLQKKIKIKYKTLMSRKRREDWGGDCKKKKEFWRLKWSWRRQKKAREKKKEEKKKEDVLYNW